jgi:hypothetical protein
VIGSHIPFLFLSFVVISAGGDAMLAPRSHTNERKAAGDLITPRFATVFCGMPGGLP